MASRGAAAEVKEAGFGSSGQGEELSPLPAVSAPPRPCKASRVRAGERCQPADGPAPGARRSLVWGQAWLVHLWVLVLLYLRGGDKTLGGPGIVRPERCGLSPERPRCLRSWGFQLHPSPMLGHETCLPPVVIISLAAQRG